jgi:hypothetical protein
MLFSRLLALDPATIDPTALAQRKPAPPSATELARRHATLSGAVVAEIGPQLARKQRYGEDLERELTLVKARWPEIIGRIGAIMLPVATIERALTEAGCPDRPSRIGCPPDRAIRALTVCRDIRDRYVALDLIDDLGLLETWAADAVHSAER